MYDKGEGVPQDYQQAVFWYRKAAEAGDTGAQSNLGVMNTVIRWEERLQFIKVPQNNLDQMLFQRGNVVVNKHLTVTFPP